MRARRRPADGVRLESTGSVRAARAGKTFTSTHGCSTGCGPTPEHSPRTQLAYTNPVTYGVFRFDSRKNRATRQASVSVGSHRLGATKTRKNAIDRWNGEQYERIVIVDNKPVRLTVTQQLNSVAPTLDVTVESARKLGDRGIDEVEHLVRKMLGLATDLGPFYELANSQGLLKPLVERFFRGQAT